MKKSISIFIVCVICINFLSLPTYANNNESIKVFLNGEQLLFEEVCPTIINGSVMVPVRAIFEALGAEVNWIKDTKTIIGKKGSLEVLMQIDNKYASVNGIQIELSTPATILNGNTLVPARFIGESLGAEVNWEQDTKTVVISTFHNITRGEFITSLVKIMGWEVNDVEEKMQDNNQISINDEAEIPGFEKAMLVAEKHVDYISTKDSLDKFITKQEAELVFIRSMGYDILEKKENYLHNSLDNIEVNTENISQKVILDMYEKILEPLEDLHGFYAIKSYDQKNLIPSFDSVSFGWSRLEYNKQSAEVVLRMDKVNGSSIYLPDKFSEPIDIAKKNNVSINLNVIASQFDRDEYGLGLVERIITSPEISQYVIKQIIEKVNLTAYNNEQVSFDGVVIDFEDIDKKELSDDFNNFLRQLRNDLDKNNKKLYVMVQPRNYLKGYDYKAIGEIADKVILMAHNYYPNKPEELSIRNPVENFYNIESPLTPIENSYNKNFDIYNALKEITDDKTGVTDKSKICLQISFDSIQWRKGESDGAIKVWSEHPLYSAIINRLTIQDSKNELNMFYDKHSENPYFTYYDDDNKIDNIIWYEDTRSVLTKISLAKLFGIKGISIWRLGNIPDYNSGNKEAWYLDTWQQILKEYNARDN